jgi:hypothetical protein
LKFVGPYKILEDFRNQSFRIELPPRLKQRGVHDVFHASLLRIHHPNDDRLFPGRLDNQLGGDIEPEGEWAVDRILPHFRSKLDSLFEIKWKVGDTTWLPYSEISHLQALSDYLELLGVDSISNLPLGTGKPPRDDPQVHIGMISFPEPLFTRKPNKALIRTRQIFASLVHRLSRISFNLPCVSTRHFDSESSASSIHSDSTIMPSPQDNTYPALITPVVTLTGRSTFTLFDPSAPAGLTSPTTISVANIFELFEHHDAIQKLETTTAELHPEPMAWDKFTRYWNFHVGKEGPCFMNWDHELGLYFRPNRIVTLADFNLSRRIPKVVSDAVKTPSVDTKVAKPNAVASLAVSHSKPRASVSSTTTTAPSASSEPSLLDFVPRDMSSDFLLLGMARHIRQEKLIKAQRDARERERHAKDAGRRKEKKQRKKASKKNNAPSSSQVEDKDVTMSDPTDSNQASSSKTVGA